MKLWATLYSVVWIVFLEFLLGTWPSPPAIVPYLHLLLGIGIVALTYNSYRLLRDTTVPARLKRIARATFAISILMVLLGLLLWFNVGRASTLPLIGFTLFQAILVFHIVNALAIITQAAALALAYDMWEDREYERTSPPGDVPPMAKPGV